MSKSIRIRTTPNGGDKYLKVNLEQDFDFVEILSLKLTQEEVYRNFCADYGVVVGRVIVNSGFGVPNAKVSIFIPIDDIDNSNPSIKGLYPYETVTDKNSDGVRYNLLPDSNESDNECYTPIGSFPSKRKVLDNSEMLDLYCKYYKFTTTTNNAGDFMIFGVPLGTYTVHVDVDISDIGIISQRPYDLIRQGAPLKLFDSPTKFKGGTNLDKLPQVKTVNAGVNVQPFWGDMDTCQIGISRVDFDLNYTLTPAAIFMGSIYGDQEKHSINKNCRPRIKLGEMCEQVAGVGTINMIRKTVDDTIEEFDVDGGQLIDEDGTWAYQVPMNLDYVVTDEAGNLIPSDDPNVGIPTRASVRFKIGMYDNGGEGRLRTRAKYLVPNNPNSTSEIDYDFGEKTKQTSFKDLYWNKIYTVSNFIARYQKDSDPKNRNMIGMKNVDNCAGDKTPFPYNRTNTVTNPIFFIICTIIKIIAFLIYFMNSTIIPLINVIVKLVNLIIDVLNTILNGISNLVTITTPTLEKLELIPCLTVRCPSDDGGYYAPGCSSDNIIDSGSAYDASMSGTTPANFTCDNRPDDCFTVGLDDCMALEMAKSLNIFQFDFYNDWVNGTLYGFLLKYKKKRKGREKFCEYDCQDFTTYPNYSGVDGNENGNPDNSCYESVLLDTCFNDNVLFGNAQLSTNESNKIKEGLIKKYDDEFYYAATTHDIRFKLYATDIICLGSIFNKDWQGVPKIQQYLTPTSYKIPSDVGEYLDNGSTLSSCGMVNPAGGNGVFFSINCLGVHMNEAQCLNIRHICEMGVDIDEAIEDPITGAITSPADCVIGENEISDINKDVRSIFLSLNADTSLGYQNISSSFNLKNIGNYDFASTGNNDNGEDYINFRGYANSTSYSQPKHSFFMYFGLLPGKTSLDKMNERFFSVCNPKIKNDLIVETSSISNGFNNYSITFKFTNGFPKYSYKVYGPNNYYLEGYVTSSPYEVTITGLNIGIYIIICEDLVGNKTTKFINV